MLIKLSKYIIYPIFDEILPVLWQCRNVMSSGFLDEEVYWNPHLHKRQIKPPEKWVGGVWERNPSLLPISSRTASFSSEFYHNPNEVSRKKAPQITLQGPEWPHSSPQTKAHVSMTTLRWDPLLALGNDREQSMAEAGSGDKERFNSICCERLLAPHVNGISRLYSAAQKTRRERQNYIVMAKSPFWSLGRWWGL